MAYSDYGAFVYEDGRRRRDREDAEAFSDDLADLPSGTRIYAHLLGQIADGKLDGDGEADGDGLPDGIFHAVMGDGPVRVCLYKCGLYASHIYALSGGDDGRPRVRDIDLYEIGRLAGQPVSPPGGADGDESYAAWERLAYGPYDLRLDVEGHRIRFEAIAPDGVHSPNFHASMECPDGTRWDAWYDMSYGAGLTDIGVDQHRWDECSARSLADADAPRWACLPLRLTQAMERCHPYANAGAAVLVGERTLAALDGIRPPDGEDPDARRLRCLYRRLGGDDMLDLPTSTLASRRGDDTGGIDPEVAMSLVRLGMRLARRGVDDVECVGYGGSWPAAAAAKGRVLYGLDGTSLEGLSEGLTAKEMLRALAADGPAGKADFARDADLGDAFPMPFPDEEERRMRESAEACEAASPRPWEMPFDEELGRRVGPEHTPEELSALANARFDAVAAYLVARDRHDVPHALCDNDFGTVIRWPVTDARGVAISPAMETHVVHGDEGDDEGEEPIIMSRWPLARRVGDPDGEELQILGVGWLEEEPVVMTVDGIAHASNIEVIDAPWGDA